MEKLSNQKIFKNGCIYTTNLEKYKYLKKKYDIINNIYTEQDEIISFINDNKSNTEIFKTYKLINFDNYKDNYYYFHKLISEQYNPETLEKGNDAFEYSVAILQDINSSRDLDVGTLSEYLKMVKNQIGDIRKNIVKEYTDDVLYKFFNKWLNELDFLAYRKISFFIALLMYGINDYNNEKKGLKNNMKLYRGLIMSYINLSFYERNVDNIITLPALTSCSSDEYIAKCFSGREKDINYQEYFYSTERRKKEGKFSVMIYVDYKYQKNWMPSAFSLQNLTYNRIEKEYVFQPYTFYKIKKFEIDFTKYEANIYLENIGKEKLLEDFIKNNKIIKFNEKQNIMVETEEKEYCDDINKILQKQYPLLTLSTNFPYENNKELKTTYIYDSQVDS